jgi:hypothetical protein
MLGREAASGLGDLRGLGGMLGGGLGGTLGAAVFNPATIGITATAAAAGELTHEFLKAAEAARHTVLEADKIGISAEEFNKLRRAAELTDTGVESVTTAIQRMNRSIADAVAGDKTKGKALTQLGLDPHEIMGKSPEEAFESIAKSVGKIGNQMERARIEAELFGRGGMEIDALMRKVAEKGGEIGRGEMREDSIQNLAAFGAAWERTKHRLSVGWNDFLGEIAGGLNRMLGIEEQLVAPINEAQRAQERLAAAAKQYADNLADAKKPLEALKDTLHEMTFGQEATSRQKFIDQYDTKMGLKATDDRNGFIAGLDKRLGAEMEAQKKVRDRAIADLNPLKNPFAPFFAMENVKTLRNLKTRKDFEEERARAIRDYDTGPRRDASRRIAGAWDRDTAIAEFDETQKGIREEREWQQRQKERTEMAARLQTPEERLKARNSQAEQLFPMKFDGDAERRLWKKVWGEKLSDEELLTRAKKGFLEDYYREAENLDAKSIRKRLKAGYDEFAAGMKSLREHGGEIGLSPEEIAREASRRNDEERKRLGIKDPLGDYARDLAEQRKAMQGGLITPEEFKDWEKRRRRQAVGEIDSDQPSLRPIAAMAAGSREAHAMITEANLADPKTKAAIDALKVLDTIAQLLREGKTVNEQSLAALKKAII